MVRITESRAVAEREPCFRAYTLTTRQRMDYREMVDLWRRTVAEEGWALFNLLTDGGNQVTIQKISGREETSILRNGVEKGTLEDCLDELDRSQQNLRTWHILALGNPKGVSIDALDPAYDARSLRAFKIELCFPTTAATDRWCKYIGRIFHIDSIAPESQPDVDVVKTSYDITK